MAEEEEVRIVYVEVGKIARWPRNPKDHDIPKIQDSLRRFGFVSPIIVDETTKRIVAGHGRLEAVEELIFQGEPPPKRVKVKAGKWYVPVLRGASFDDEDEAEAYLVADNWLSQLGGWDQEALAEMAQGFDDLTGTGLDEESVVALLEASAALKGPDDSDFEGERPAEVPADDPDHTVAKGDVKIAIGKFKIMVARETYDGWLDKVRKKVGFEKKVIEAEITKRLGL